MKAKYKVFFYFTKERVKKKKVGIFPLRGGAFRFRLFFPLFLFIFKHGLTEDKAKMIVESLVHSTINYMGILYLRLPSNQKKVQKLLNRASRLVLKADPLTHVEDMNRELYWLNCENTYKHLILMALRRLRYGNCRAMISWDNVFVTQPTLYKLRSVHLRVQWTKITCHGRNSFIYQSTHLMNELEISGALYTSDTHFKQATKFILYRDFYNGNL